MERFHTVPTIRRHTVGHHSYEVAMFAWLLSDGNTSNPRISARLLLAALMHDLVEADFGDIPSPTKRGRSDAWRMELRAAEANRESELGIDVYISEGERRILKLADMFSGMFTCIKERRMGNTEVTTAYMNFKSYVTNLKPGTVKERNIFDYLHSQWEKANDSK